MLHPLCCLQGPEGAQFRSAAAAAAAAAAAPTSEGEDATLRQAVTLRRVLPFAYFQVYDYNLFWNTDDDNVLGGGYAGTVVSWVYGATNCPQRHLGFTCPQDCSHQQ